MLVGVSEGPSQGWGSAQIIGALVVGSVALALLVLIETRIDDPALLLRLYRDRLFRATNLTSAPVFMGFFSLIFLLPVFLQKVGDHSPFITGITVSFQAVGVIISSQLTGRWAYKSIGPRGLLTFGSLAAMIVSLWFATIDETTSLAAIAGVTFLRGLAMGFVFIPIQTATYATIPLPDMGRATSLFNMQRQAAVGAGVAVVATVLSSMVNSLDSPADGGAATVDRVAAFRMAFLVSALCFGVGAIASRLIHNEDAAATMSARR